MNGDPLIGRILGDKYKIIEQVGLGGMANVYKARQEKLNRFVAVKVMHPFLVDQEGFLPRFKREAKAMAILDHPGIVEVHDFDVFGQNTYYLVMEYISGGTLKDKLEELEQLDQFFPLEQTIRIANEIASALAYAHRQGMIHRDIKSGNIMLNENGKTVLTDFGIVKMVGGQSSMVYTTTGALIGSPAYIAPEQALGKPGDQRADIYSLGVLLFQIATGQLPYTADTPLAVALKHVNETPPLPISINPQIPIILQNIILKAMAKDPDKRFQSVEEMVHALQAVDLTKKVEHHENGLSLSHATPHWHREPYTPPEIHPMVCSVCEQVIEIKESDLDITCSACQTHYLLEGHLCPYCHAYYEDEPTFCRECGEAMIRMCYHCQTNNWAGVERCQNCKRPLDIFEALQTRTNKSVINRLQNQIEAARDLKDLTNTASEQRMAKMKSQANAHKLNTRRRQEWQFIFRLVGFVMLFLIVAFLFLIWFGVIQL